MHTEVFNNIDMLINMAGESLNIDEINSELLSLKRLIRNKKNEIEDLEILMVDTRYFNASNELVDKNIEISLKNKINRLKRKLKDFEACLNEIKSEEKLLDEDIASLKSKLAKNEVYVKTLKIKVDNSLNNTYYLELLKKEEANVLELNKELEVKTESYNNILKELELNNEAINEMKNKIDTEESRLKSILDNLKNPNAYIDEDLKDADKLKLDTLKEDLAKLEKRELELLTNASVIGSDAKELIASNEIRDALNKIKELVTIVKTKPYMNINNETILDEELEKKENYRIELSSLIDSKNYNSINSNAISNRIEFLNKENVQNKLEIDKYLSEISKIDNFINNELGKIIDELEQEVLQSEKTLSEYKVLVKEKNKTSKARANIENAILKKEKEKKIIDDILLAYKENLLSKIEETNMLERIIKKLENENIIINNEIKKLEKLAMIDLANKDLVEEEKDKEELKKLNEEIKAIKERKKYSKTADEIFDEIDMTLATMKLKEMDEEVFEIASVVDNDYEKDYFDSPMEMISDIILEKEEKIKAKEEGLSEGAIEPLLMDNATLPNNEVVIEPLNVTEKIEAEPIEDAVINNVIEPVNFEVNEPVKEIIGEIKNEEPQVLEIDSLFTNNTLKENINGRIKVVEMIPVETVKKSEGEN